MEWLLAINSIKRLLFLIVFDFKYWLLLLSFAEVYSSKKSSKRHHKHHSTTALKMNLSPVIQKLWEADVNRFVPGKDFEINQQGGKSLRDGTKDVAPNPLFTYVNEEKLKSIPTYIHFENLLNNYNAYTGVAEVETIDELNEQDEFINAVVATKCNQVVLDYVLKKGLWKGSLKEWKMKLKEIWFGLHKRVVSGDSCAFEHVFIGEIRNKKAIGFHNWISIYHAEKEGSLNYFGHVYPNPHSQTHQNKGPSQHVLQLQFTYLNKLKLLSTSLIGVSPEFELSLYTLVLLSGQHSVHCVLDDVACHVVLYNMHENPHEIGTAYIQI